MYAAYVILTGVLFCFAVCSAEIHKLGACCDSSLLTIMASTQSESPHSSPFLITEPTQICSFSRTETGAIAFDDRSRRFFHEPRLGIDLRAGWDDFYTRYRGHRFIGHPRRVDEILEACLRSDQAKKQLATADVVTWRGLLSKYDHNTGTATKAVY